MILPKEVRKMTDLFYNISDKDKERIFKYLEASTVTYPKGINIMSNINMDNIIGVVQSGCIQIIRNDYDGKRIILNELKDGGVFGSIILPVTDDSYDIFAKEATKVILIDYDRITEEEIVKHASYKQFIKNLLKLITEIVLERNERIEILTQKSIRDKLLEYFRQQEQKMGSKTFLLPFNFTELSEYLAVDRSAMSRELKNIKDEGFVKIKNKKVTLLY